MRFILSAVLCLPGAAMAHPGHLAETAGHDHWGAAIAIGLAIGVAVWAGLKDRRKDKAETESAEADSDEAAA